jgi:superfamily II DNA/RNA helicase
MAKDGSGNSRGTKPDGNASQNNNKNNNKDNGVKESSNGRPNRNRNQPNNDGQKQATIAPAEKRVQRKANKRQLQLEAMQKKAEAEDRYFRQCQREAADINKRTKSSNSNSKSTSNPDQLERASRESEQKLFGLQAPQGINFDKYDAIKVEVKKGESISFDGFTDYDELSLHATFRRNIELMHYKRPTPIQRYAIPLAIGGDDLMCCAQTGSGKTCAFLLPVCVSLQKTAPPPFANGSVSPRCVVLAPTRELASQIESEAQKLCHDSAVKTVVVYGGASQRQQIRELAFGADIIVATPGRLMDFVDRSLIRLGLVKFLVLDEADRMLDMGFEPQIRKIVQTSGMTIKEKRQTFMFSATFPNKIQLLARQFLRDQYAWIAVGRVGSTTDSITQVLVQADADKRHKLKLVVEALQKGPEGRTLIFVQKKKTATWLKKQLNKGGPDDGKEDERFTPIPSTDIHGDRSQSQREAALASFRSGDCRVLVATDVAARGLDISGVEHVINMDLPVAIDDFDSYVHRIGRTGRAGHTGLATSLFVPGDAPKVGNGKIAKSMVTQLKEAGQEVPSWLEAEVAGGGGGKAAATPKLKFGGTDVRNDGGNDGRGRGGRGGGGRGRRRGGRGGGRSNGRQTNA